MEEEAPDLLCHLENVQGLVDALSAVRWKRHQVILSFIFSIFPLTISLTFSNAANSESPWISPPNFLIISISFFNYCYYLN